MPRTGADGRAPGQALSTPLCRSDNYYAVFGSQCDICQCLQRIFTKYKQNGNSPLSQLRQKLPKTGSRPLGKRPDIRANR